MWDWLDNPFATRAASAAQPFANAPSQLPTGGQLSRPVLRDFTTDGRSPLPPPGPPGPDAVGGMGEPLVRMPAASISNPLLRAMAQPQMQMHMATPMTPDFLRQGYGR